MDRSIKECIDITQLALHACAKSCVITKDVDDALKMADATEKLSRSLSYLNQIKEREV